MLSGLCDRIILALATGMGVGLIPVMPGTFGSLWGPLYVWGLRSLSLSPVWGALLSLAVIVLGIPICDRASTLLGRKDPGAVVYDEIAAFPLVFAAVPLTPANALAGFVCFRVCDMTKPWPIRTLEKVPGGTGVMLDDLLAAAYAALLLWGGSRFWN